MALILPRVESLYQTRGDSPSVQLLAPAQTSQIRVLTSEPDASQGFEQKVAEVVIEHAAADAFGDPGRRVCVDLALRHRRTALAGAAGKE
jgi:hypothetical protein